MCDWLGVDLVQEDPWPSMDPWIPNHNKIPFKGSDLYARESSLPEKPPELIFTHTWARGCSELRGPTGDMLPTWPSSGTGNAAGIPGRIQGGPYRQLDNPVLLRAKLIYTAGVDCITRAGFPSYGLMAFPDSPQNRLPLISTASTRRSTRAQTTPRRPCIGKTGRWWSRRRPSWRPRLGWRRRSRNLRRERALARRLQIAFQDCMLLQCPRHPCWHRVCHCLHAVLSGRALVFAELLCRRQFSRAQDGRAVQP